MRSTFCRAGLLFLLPLLSSCAHQNPPAPSAETPESVSQSGDDDGLPGPTLMARVDGGYELKNRWVRAVIADKTGHVTYWGPADGRRNMLLEDGIVVRLAKVASTKIDGYVEKRDDQTWQYIGEDEVNKIGWRKIYCLEGPSLMVTYLVQNKTGQEMKSRIVVSAAFAGLRINEHTPDYFDAIGSYGAIRVRGFNETHERAQPPALPVIVVSDEHRFAPGDRQSFTTEWRLDLTDAARH